jgi:hypothetical protein
VVAELRDATSALRLFSARALVFAISLAFSAATFAFVVAQPHAPLAQPDFGSLSLFGTGGGPIVVARSIASTAPTRPVFHGLGSTCS